MITYGHEKFIREAIEGVLSQKCSHEIELIIADDNSPDKTKEIVEDIIRSHPNGSWIKYTRHQENKGMTPNFIWALQQSKAEYIALCEGDDYWTDPLKLQKQVEFLEAHQNCTGCFHNSIIVNQNNEEIYLKRPTYKRTFYNQKEALISLRSNYATSSFTFKTEVIKNPPKWFLDSACDMVLELLVTKYGSIACIDEIMSVYRVHSGGVWQGKSAIHNTKEVIKRLEILLNDKTLKSNYGDILKRMLLSKFFFLVESFKDKPLLRIKYGFRWIFIADKYKLLTYKLFLTNVLFPKLYKKMKG
jgi:glycosyltransferase involved in cell wall biosynthesis